MKVWELRETVLLNEEAKKQYRQLLQDLTVWGKAYYEQDEPLVSDEVYDAHLMELKRLEKTYPELLSECSPTQKIGGQAKRAFKKYQHPVQMQSLQDVFHLQEVKAFLKDTAESPDTLFVVEEKMDGLSVSLRYEQGRLISAATRGDGFLGEEVTENIRTLKEVPQVLPFAIPYLELRAEVYMTHQAFQQLNAEIEARNQEKLANLSDEEMQTIKLEKKLANPRNAAAGSLRQLKVEITAQRQLSIAFFNIQAQRGLENFVSDQVLYSHHLQLEFLKSMGFPCVKLYGPWGSYEEIERSILKIGEERETLAYDIDGAVVKVEDIRLRQKLGETAKTPKWAVAYKYPSKKVLTRLKGVEIQVGRTGKLTPVAQLEPVLLQGSVISKATLHNANYIFEKDIRIGDYVYIEKAGDVIPAVSSVCLNKRLDDLPIFEMPLVCPSCGSLIQQKTGEVAHYCLNDACLAKKMRLLEYAVSKAALDVKGLGPSILRILEEKGFLLNLKDLFLLKDRKDELLALEGFQEKSVQNLLDEIEMLKGKSLASWLAALGIEGVAQETAKELAKHFESFTQFFESCEEDFLKIEGIGSKLSQNLVSFFSKKENQDTLKNLKALGVRFENPLYGSYSLEASLKKPFKVVITGKFEAYSREELTQKVENLGAKVLSAVSKNVNVLFCGEQAGSKLEKAQSLGIEILFEKDLEAWFKKME